MDKLENRKIKVVIVNYDENNNETILGEFENLNVKFSYKKSISVSNAGEGTVAICGLSKDLIQQMTSIYSNTRNLNKRIEIRLYAGYKETSLIISGTIKYAKPTMPPDIWIECDVINGYRRRETCNNKTFEGIYSLKDISSMIAQYLGLNLIYRIENGDFENVKAYNFTADNCNDYALVNKLTELVKPTKENKYGICAFIDGENLIVDYLALKPTLKERIDKAINIDLNNGMVGLPEPSHASYEVTITTLLDNSIKLCDVIKLDSLSIKALNGNYYVQRIAYNGEFRGQNFYSVFSCRRIL